jgi:hypothetical protein
MKADPEKAKNLGSRLVSYKDSLAKQRVEVLDATALRAILDDTSHDALAAEQELVMAWRFYTQEREQQIAWGEFCYCSSTDEIQAARQFSRAKAIVFDPASVKGIECIEAQIQAAIGQDVQLDAVKWQAVKEHDEKSRMELEKLWAPAQPPGEDTVQERKSRKEFAEGNIRWLKSRNQFQFRKYYFDRIADAIRRMLDEHRDYWAQRPTEPYDDSGLSHIFAFALDGPNHGLGELFMAWDRYLECRIWAHDYKSGVPFEICTDAESASAKEERRKLPIEWPHLHPNAREIAESYIKAIIREDILADTDKWERHKRSVENAKKRYQEKRLQRIENHRNAFISKVRNMFGQKVLALISEEDVRRYSLGIVDRLNSEEELWYSILKQYDFDQNTNSCVYFIRQGNAIKIGITDNLDQRFAQIKTSAALPCEIMNVVYTHHGISLERILHQALAKYNTHLEWFILPARIEKMLFSAKSVKDIERVLEHTDDTDL